MPAPLALRASHGHQPALSIDRASHDVPRRKGRKNCDPSGRDGSCRRLARNAASGTDGHDLRRTTTSHHAPPPRPTCTAPDCDLERARRSCHHATAGGTAAPATATTAAGAERSAGADRHVPEEHHQPPRPVTSPGMHPTAISSERASHEGGRSQTARRGGRWARTGAAPRSPDHRSE